MARVPGVLLTLATRHAAVENPFAELGDLEPIVRKLFHQQPPLVPLTPQQQLVQTAEDAHDAKCIANALQCLTTIDSITFSTDMKEDFLIRMDDRRHSIRPNVDKVHRFRAQWKNTLCAELLVHWRACALKEGNAFAASYNDVLALVTNFERGLTGSNAQSQSKYRVTHASSSIN